MTRKWTRWLPAAVIPAVIAVGAIVAPLQASAGVSLPETTPRELLELVSTSDVQALSGTIEQESDLGLPDLSALSGSGAGSSGTDLSSALELVTGSHTARVYLDGPSRSRMQVLDALAERNLVRNGDDVWFYSSRDKTATHLVLPAGALDQTRQLTQTPQELADEFLSKIDPSTEVTVGTNASVAGRTAYELILTPRENGTLVGSVSIAVDSETGLPLRVEVLARGQAAPAFSVAFSDVSLEAPDAALFAFTPPEGTTVTEQELPVGDPSKGDPVDAPPVTVTGEAWTAVVELAAGALPAEFTESPLYRTATEPVSGGRVISTALVSVLFTDDGRVFAGSVSPEQLQDAAAGR